MRITRRTFVVGSPAVLAAAAGHAQSDFPSKRVTFLVAWAPGGVADNVARYFAKQLAADWKVPVVVENRPGAEGVVGAQAVMRLPADGHTLLFTGPTMLTAPMTMKPAPYELADFQTVARTNAAMVILVASRNAPFNSLRELIAQAKKPGSKLDIAVSSTITEGFVTALNQAAGTDIRPIQYKGAQQVNDTVSGEVSASLLALAAALPLVRAGQLKALAVSGTQRSTSLPEVPTFVETGFPAVQLVSFTAAFVAAGTPDAMVRKLAAGIRQAADTPEFRSFALAQGFDPGYIGPEWDLKAEQAHWVRLVELGQAKPKS